MPPLLQVFLFLLLIPFFFLHSKLGHFGSISDHSDDDHHNSLKKCNFDRIYQLGDSLSDTGNLVLEIPLGAATNYAKLPYGQTYFGKATGRCTDGRLMIDYLAMDAGLPYLNPYENSSANFSHGANFAVGSATALSKEVLATKNFTGSRTTNNSLNVQLHWLSTHFKSICSTDRDCREKLKNSLFMVGEIGGNDYNYAFFRGRTIEEIKTLVPDVVQAIIDAVRIVIKFGASRVVVPGDLPIGCTPNFLTLFETNNPEDYDDHHCLKDLNNFSMFHNEHIQRAIQELKRENPNTIILYGDYYNAFQWVFRRAQYLGFDSNSLRKACCGSGGDYNFSSKKTCDSTSKVCPDPRRYISWDGLHLTQEAYKNMATWLISDILPKLQCTS